MKRFTQKQLDNVGYVIWDNNHNTHLNYDVICQYLNDWTNSNKEIEALNISCDAWSENFCKMEKNLFNRIDKLEALISKAILRGFISTEECYNPGQRIESREEAILLMLKGNEVINECSAGVVSYKYDKQEPLCPFRSDSYGFNSQNTIIPRNGKWRLK